jgi:hypothetical protein
MRGNNTHSSGAMDEEDPANESNFKSKQNPKIDLSSPEFDPSQYLATTHAVSLSLSLSLTHTHTHTQPTHQPITHFFYRQQPFQIFKMN